MAVSLGRCRSRCTQSSYDLPFGVVAPSVSADHAVRTGQFGSHVAQPVRCVVVAPCGSRSRSAMRIATNSICTKPAASDDTWAEGGNVVVTQSAATRMTTRRNQTMPPNDTPFVSAV